MALFSHYELDDLHGGRFRHEQHMKPISFLRDGSYRRIGYNWAAGDATWPHVITKAGMLVYLPAEWAALTATEKQRVQSILSMGTVNLGGANTRASLAAAFGVGTTTRANVLALYQQANAMSRAEELGLGEVAVGHIAEARAWEG